jgi:hypothetical protein
MIPSIYKRIIHPSKEYINISLNGLHNTRMAGIAGLGSVYLTRHRRAYLQSLQAENKVDYSALGCFNFAIF